MGKVNGRMAETAFYQKVTENKLRVLWRSNVKFDWPLSPAVVIQETRNTSVR